MEAFSALLALCARNSPHKSQWRGALMFSLICAFNKRLSKQSWGWWFETLSRSLWRIWNVQELWWIYIQLSISLTTFRKTVFFIPVPTVYVIIFLWVMIKLIIPMFTSYASTGLRHHGSLQISNNHAESAIALVSHESFYLAQISRYIHSF